MSDTTPVIDVGEINPNPDRPCQGCPDRYLACSDHCTKPIFLAWKEKQAQIREAKQREAHIWGYTANEIRKNRRRGGGR